MWRAGRALTLDPNAGLLVLTSRAKPFPFMSSVHLAGKPRHETVSTWIRSKIEAGEWTEDHQLPSESQLGKQFDVSRITVRRALQTLETDNLIYRRQGLGSFVKDNRIHQGLVRLTDFVEDMEAAGLVPASRILHYEQEIASTRISEQLELENESPVMRIDRLRTGDGEPMAFDRTWLPMFYAQLLSDFDMEKETIFTVLEREYDICVCRGRFRIEAINAPNDVAQFLDVPWGRALLVIERTSYTEQNRPIYYQQRFYRSDRVAYDIELKRSRNGSALSPGLPLTEFEPVFKK